jgi:NTP pyrophosphatase (non-canonical NTP hydrolase)
MNRLEHLLQILQEECAEVAQAASKANRFGLDDGYPGTERTNRTDLGKELAQVKAMIEMIEADGHMLTGHNSRTFMAQKKAKVEEMLRYSAERGCLN